MLWFFERGDQRLQFEMRPAADGTGFELVWQTPDGETHLEQSEDPAVLTDRRMELETTLKHEGWTRVGRITPDRRFL
jgi:hypothetical protein